MTCLHHPAEQMAKLGRASCTSPGHDDSRDVFHGFHTCASVKGAEKRSPCWKQEPNMHGILLISAVRLSPPSADPVLPTVCLSWGQSTSAAESCTKPRQLGAGLTSAKTTPHPSQRWGTLVLKQSYTAEEGGASSWDLANTCSTPDLPCLSFCKPGALEKKLQPCTAQLQEAGTHVEQQRWIQ